MNNLKKHILDIDHLDRDFIYKILEKTKSLKRPEKDADVAKLERRLSDHFGARTKIEEKAKGAGELIVEYSSLEELEGIIEKIGIDSR